MPFPPVDHCVVCDDVRPEIGGKLSILGFYGITPDVEILVPSFDQVLGKLVFIIMQGPWEGSVEISADLMNQQGKSILRPKGPRTPIQVSYQPRGRNMIALAMMSVLFPGAGEYRLHLTVNGERRYETSFRVGEGKPGQFL